MTTPRNRACGSCGSPSWANGPCYERIDRPEFYRRSGADAPCEAHKMQQEHQIERHRWAWAYALLSLIGAAIWLGAIAYSFSHV